MTEFNQASQSISVRPKTLSVQVKSTGGMPSETSDDKSRSQTDQVHVFISYAHNDIVIADRLRDALIEINRSRVNCFLDTKSIQSGQGWEQELESALERADWLICIYTGEQSDYCGYEVGVFTGGKALAANGTDVRLVCLHDVPGPPGMFRNHQNKFVQFLPPYIAAAAPELAPSAWSEAERRFHRESDVFKFLSDFCRFQGLYVAHDIDEADRQTQLLLGAAKRITEAFDAARGSDVKSDTPTQLTLEVSFPASVAGAIEGIPSDATVTGTFGSFALFGLMPPMENKQLPTTTWEQIREACTSLSSANAMWMESIERDMIGAANGKALDSPEAIFASAFGGKVYRPILVRHIVRYNGTRLFGIVFVETLPRQFLGHKTTSLLLAGLVMASRFRFAYLEQPDQVAARFDDRLSERDFLISCKQLRYDVERIRCEALEFGLLDPVAFVKAFGESRRALAESFGEAWEKEKAELLPQLPSDNRTISLVDRGRAKSAISTFLSAMKEENRRFVLAAMEAYRDEIIRQE